jgi:hypothetical protein
MNQIQPSQAVFDGADGASKSCMEMHESLVIADAGRIEQAEDDTDTSLAVLLTLSPIETILGCSSRHDVQSICQISTARHANGFWTVHNPKSNSDPDPDPD